MVGVYRTPPYVASGKCESRHTNPAAAPVLSAEKVRRRIYYYELNLFSRNLQMFHRIVYHRMSVLLYDVVN